MVVSFQSRTQEYFKELQDLLCSALARCDGRGLFHEDVWSHREGGGGRTRVLQDGDVFEKAGVNFSAVKSMLGERLAARLAVEPQPIFASGISLVIHPRSPMIPTVHMNLRYLELKSGDAWFGGGTDLTPYYVYDDDVRHFHQVLKSVCDRYDADWYPRFKKSCDEYFFLPHRGEARGVGGLFFDYQRQDMEKFFRFAQDVGRTFQEAYLPIVERRKSTTWSEAEKHWQQIRRGRYVEFNLVYDRGTLFGLETGGRTESILMSLPPEAAWPYDHPIEKGSREEELLGIIRQPREWV